MNVIDVLSAPWAIIPDRLDEITEIYSTHLRGEKLSAEEIQARTGSPDGRKRQGYKVIDGVAVIPMEGVIAKRMNLFTRISGGVSTQLLERDFRQAMDDDDVHSIVLHADTPGGSVDGTAEVAKVIFEARGDKPIVTLADGLLASAGVWIGSAADRVYMTGETTFVGSIGVVTQHVDYSEAYRKAGIKVTEIYAGKYKRIAGAYKRLSKEGKKYLQEEVDYLYSLFVDTVAAHRGTDADDVLERMADGRLFVGQQAIDAGLVDGVATLDQLIADLGAAAKAESAEEARNPSVTVSPAASATEGLPADLAQAFDEGFAAGAAAELRRSTEILAQRGAFSPEQDSMLEAFAQDGKTTSGDAALAVIASVRRQLAAAKAATEADAAELDGVTPSVELEVPARAGRFSGASDSELRSRWESDAELRREFSESFSRFEAFARNERLTVVEGGRADGR